MNPSGYPLCETTPKVYPNSAITVEHIKQYLHWLKNDRSLCVAKELNV